MESAPSPTRRLIEEILGTPLDDFVAERRADGRSWRRVALDLREATGVDLTGETLRLWFTREEAKAS